MASDPLQVKILLRLRQSDAAAAQRVERALSVLLDEGGLADLTQHDLQAYLWFGLPDEGIDEPEATQTAAALARFFELADLNRYAAIAGSSQTMQILRTYAERGHSAGARAANKAMDASGVVPPDLPELEWGEVMGAAEMDAYTRVAATLELALAAGEFRPGMRGWRQTQQRLARTQLSMARPDGAPLLERVQSERLESWAEAGGPARRLLASAVLPGILAAPALPRAVAERVAPMQWLLQLAAGQDRDTHGIALTLAGNLARRVVQEATQRFSWGEPGGQAPRSEADIWQLGELRALLQHAGALRRTGRSLVLAPRGRLLLGDPGGQWNVATASLVRGDDFERAAQEAALMLLTQASGMVEVRELVREVAELLTDSGWRDTGNAAPPNHRDVERAVWEIIRRAQLWSLAETSMSSSPRLRLDGDGHLAAYAAIRRAALRPRRDSDR